MREYPRYAAFYTQIEWTIEWTPNREGTQWPQRKDAAPRAREECSGQGRQMAFPHRDHGRPRHRAPPHHRDHGTGQIRRPPTPREQAQGIRAHGHHPFQSVALPARLHHPMVRAAPPRPETQHLVQPRQAVQHHRQYYRGSAARRAHARARAPHDGQARPNPRAANRARIPRDTQTGARRRRTRGAHRPQPLSQGQAATLRGDPAEDTRRITAQGTDRSGRQGTHGRRKARPARLPGGHRDVGHPVRTRVRHRHEGRRTIRAHALRARNTRRHTRHLRPTAAPGLRRRRRRGEYPNGTTPSTWSADSGSYHQNPRKAYASCPSHGTCGTGCGTASSCSACTPTSSSSTISSADPYDRNRKTDAGETPSKQPASHTSKSTPPATGQPPESPNQEPAKTNAWPCSATPTSK